MKGITYVVTVCLFSSSRTERPVGYLSWGNDISLAFGGTGGVDFKRNNQVFYSYLSLSQRFSFLIAIDFGFFELLKLTVAKVGVTFPSQKLLKCSDDCTISNDF